MRHAWGHRYSEAEWDALCEKWEAAEPPAERPNHERLRKIYKEALDLDARKLADDIGHELYVNHIYSDVEPWLVDYFADQLAARKAATC